MPAALLLWSAALPVQAAGGHHDVDDATMLSPGQCQLETWLVEVRSPDADLVHVGPACHWAGIEWGFNAERVRAARDSASFLGPQAKWVVDVVDKRFSAGAVVALAWRAGGTDRSFATAYVPLSAWLGPAEQLQLNLNLGRDHDSQDGGFRRWGIGADWSPTDRLLLTAERREVLAQRLTRVGVRWSFTPSASVDASVARAGDARLYALGVNWAWER